MDSATPPDEDAAPKPETSNASMANLERTFLRLTFWQTLLSLATLDGKAIVTWDEVIARLLESPAQIDADFDRSSISRRVIAPGESIVVFQTKDPSLALHLQEAVYGGRAILRHCYCSIFAECWQHQTWSDASGEGGDQAMDACPDYGEAGFLD